MVAEAKGRLSLDGRPFIDTLRDIGDKAEKGLGDKIVALGKKIAAAFAVREIIQFTNAALRLGDEIDNLASQTDLGYESVQALKVAAEDAGVSFETMRPSINAMRRAIDQARTGNEGMVEAFNNMGISIEEVRELNTEQIFDRITGAMADSNAGADTLTASTKILGAESTRLQGLLIDLGSQGFGNVIEQMKEQNRILNNDTVEALDKAEETVTKFTDAVRNTFITAVAQVIEFGQELHNTDSIEMRNVKEAIREVAREISALEEVHSAAIRKMQESQRDLAASTNDLSAAQDRYNDELFKSLDDEEKQKVLKRDIAELQEQVASGASDEAEARDRARQAQDDLVAASREAKQTQSATNETFAELQRIQEEIERLENNSVRSRGAIQARNREIKALEDERTIVMEEHQRLQAEAIAAKTRETDATTELQEAEAAINDAQTQQLEARTGILQAQRTLNGLTKEQADNENEIAQALATSEQVIEARLAKRNEELLNLNAMITTLNEMLAVERDKNGESDRAIQLARMLDDAQRQLAAATGEAVEKQEEATTATADQLDAVERLRELFQVMTEQELQNLLDQLRNIATQLSQLPDVGNLDWIEALSGLDFRGISETRARMVADAMRLLAEELSDVANVNPAAFDFLEKLNDFELPRLSRARAQMFADAMEELTDSLQGVDVASIEMLVDALKDLDALKLIGETTVVTVGLPDDFDGVPLIFSDSIRDTMSSIDMNLKTLAQLKGIVWA